MLRSLWFKLVGAFAVVIAVMVLVITLAVNQAMARAFDRYTVNSGVLWAEMLAPVLAEQYAITGNWDSAQMLLAAPWSMPGGQGRGMMAGHQAMHGGMGPGSNMWGRMGWRIVLVDERGQIVADTGDELQGEFLPDETLERGTPIYVNGEKAATLLLISTQDYTPVQLAFLSATRRAVLLAGLAAGAAALLLGTLIFVAIMRPLQHLRVAAEKVAAGDLTTRVPELSRDELGAVATAFNQMAERLNNQQQIRQQMVADIAHELRTPISVIQGTLEAMLDEVLEPRPEELRDLHTETRRLARLVEDLRMLSLADAGQLTLVRGPTDLAGLVGDVVGRMQPLAETREIALQAEIVQPVSLAYVDSDRIAQVLTNLIDNALRYTPPGGQVVVWLTQAGDRVQLSVADNGPGIPAEDLPYVFERFWRGDRSRSRHSGGSGLGLAIARQLVELHGGTISVESQVGRGSTFTASLPIATGGA